jgi:tetratricopeptide (TPR) repeat protein
MLLNKDFDEADKHLEAARNLTLPAPMEAMREMFEGLILMSRAATEAGVKRFDAAERLQPGIPVMKLLRADVAARANDFGESLKLVRQYLAEVGPDADAFVTEGYALEGLDRFPEAADSYRNALADIPDLSEALDGLRRVLDDEKKEELARFVAKAPNPLKSYDELLRSAEESIDSTTVNVLKAWLRQAHPDDWRAIRDQFQELIAAGKFDQAASALHERLKPDVKDDVKRTTLDTYLFQMIVAERILEAYAAVPPAFAKEAFRTLAEDLEERGVELPANPADRNLVLARDLIKAHRKRAPEDANLWYCEAALLMHEQRYAEAERVLADGVAKLSPPVKTEKRNRFEDDPEWNAERFRGVRVTCLFRLKQGLKAYAEIGPREATFEQLAYAYEFAKDAPGLEALLAAHRRNAPGDASLKYWAAELLYLRGEYRAASDGLRAYILESGEKSPHRWMAIDHCLRGYLRAELPGKARDAQAEIGPQHVPAGLRAAVFLANGRPALAEEVLAESAARGPGGYLYMYYDEDFIRLIQLPQYESLRKKYPDTRNQPSDGVIS